MPVDMDDLDKMGVRKFVFLQRFDDGGLVFTIVDKDVDERHWIYYFGVDINGQSEIAAMQPRDLRIFALITPADFIAHAEGGESAPGYGP